jgi:anti-anti-sigma regulatory factor/anti-sigma regulatory factor (Ser/Thr protein kinase)
MGEPRIRCQVHRTFPIGLIEVVGPLRLDTVPRLRAVVLKVLAERPDAIVLDIAGLDDVAELSVAVFTALSRTVTAADGELILAAGGPGPGDTLRRAAPLFLRIFDTYEQAMNAAVQAPARRRVARQLPADPYAGRTARRVVETVCIRWGLTGLRDAAEMIVTELAANAVEHVGRPVELCVTVRRRVLRIEVSDSSTVLPARLDPSPGTARGHGLWLVDGLASRWGATPTKWGKTVWADLVLSAPRGLIPASVAHARNTYTHQHHRGPGCLLGNLRSGPNCPAR